jgi:hypothetical protein
MKKAISLVFAVAMIVGAVSMVTLNAYADDYKGDEARGSIFQVLGDMITGNYKIDGKPIKEKGWLQVTADETQKMKLFSQKEDAAKE